jgi:glycosyltransferase involved in cell wall biosynthesis
MSPVSKSIVSVLTPVYNGEATIVECIDSLRRQTFTDWSLVVIDNASSDDTASLVDHIARRDPRVNLVRETEFVDANENLNRAFAHVDPASTYCKVLLADDKLYPRCLELMVDLAQRHPRVGVVGAYRVNGSVIDLTGLPPSVTTCRGVDILRQSLLGGPYVTGSPTSLLLRTELVLQRQPMLDLSFWHADTEAAYWAFTQSDFGLVHQVLTFTRREPGRRMDWSNLIGSHWPESIRMLLRYGPTALERAEYRSRLNFELRRYCWYHLKQRMRPSRIRDREFRDFHRDALRRIAEDGQADRAVQAAIRFIAPLLTIPSPGRRSHGHINRDTSEKH